MAPSRGRGGGALAPGALLPRLDRSVDGSLPYWLRAVVFSGESGAARTVLDAVSSSLINVTTFTFSLTVLSGRRTSEPEGSAESRS